jgi:putative hydrolase
MINRLIDGVDPDPKQVLAALKRAFEAVRGGRNPLDDGGIVALIAGPEQHAVLQRVQGLMSLLEGHGDVTMDRAGADRIPSADRFSRVLKERRADRRGPARLVQQLIGLDAKMKQYERGEKFIAHVEAQGGPHALDAVWQSPDLLPSTAEIADPDVWLSRVHGAAAASR